MGLFSSILKGVTGAGLGFLTGGPAGAVAGGIGGLTSGAGAGGNKKAIDAATQAQLLLGQQGIDEQRRQFDTTQSNFAPWLQSGQSALAEQNALLGIGTPSIPGKVDWAKYVQGNPDALANWNAVKGTQNDTFGGDIAKFGEYHYGADGSRRDLTPFTTGGFAGSDGGPEAQAAAIEALRGSPLYESLFRNGQDTLLNNASATGGLRGGNFQTGLANFGRDTLAQVIQQQLANLGGIAGNGQGAAGSLSGAGQSSTNNIIQLLGQQGQIQAGGILGKQAVNNNSTNSFLSGLGGLLGNGGAQNAVTALGKLF